MIAPPAILSDQTSMAMVMKIFDKTHANWLPVINKDNHLKGYISRERIYTQYRRMVADMSED